MGRVNIVVRWAQSGLLTDPGVAESNEGFESEIPQARIQNWWQNRADESLTNLEETGIQRWDALTDYHQDGLCIADNGVLYQSQQEPNVNHDPEGDSGTWWEQANFAVSLVAAGGYIKFSGAPAFIVQWGVTTVPANRLSDNPVMVTLPVAYDNVHAHAIASQEVTGVNQDEDAAAWNGSLTQIELHNAHNSSRDVHWLSMGW